MVAEWLQKLLVLQDRDSRCDTIRHQLEAIPGQISSDEREIASQKTALQEMEEAIKALEVRRLNLEGDVEQAEASIVKYKTQQMEVKKNEEYSALEKEIGNLQQMISELEDEELLLMEDIDQKQAELLQARDKTKDECATLEAHISLLKKNHAACASELDAATKAVADCEAGLDPGVLQQYKYVKGQVKRPPVVVPLEDNRCQGCHLKVSGEVESEARRGKDLVRCDSCGRILYYDR